MTPDLTPPPSSRREARRQARRDAIVQIAAQTFLENGYAGTTMSGVASALGGSKATLWNYFPSKQELFVAVLAQRTADYREQLAVILDPQRDVVEALRGFCREYLTRVNSSESVALYRLVVAESGRFPEIAAIFHEQAPQLTHAQLSRFIAGAMERGALRTADAALAATQLIGLCLAGSRQRLLMGFADAATAKEIAEDGEAAMDLFMRGYGP